MWTGVLTQPKGADVALMIVPVADVVERVRLTECRELEAFGSNVTIVVDDKQNIVAGHQRVLGRARE